MLDYQTFKAVTEENLKQYLPEAFQNEPHIIKQIFKVNETKDTLLFPGKNPSPSIDINDMYEMYKESHDVDAVFQFTAKKIRYSMKMEADSLHLNNKRIFDKDYIKDHVFCMLINTDANEKMLSEIPHRSFCDLSVIYRLMVNENSDSISSTVIGNELFKELKCTEEELYHLAVANTKEMFPSVVTPLGDALASFGKPVPYAPSEMLVLSNEKQTFGATSMLYPEAFDKIAERLNSDFIILPSSLHEVIILPADIVSPEEASKAVFEINRDVVPLKDVLSNQVYKYDRRERQLLPACEPVSRSILPEKQPIKEVETNIGRIPIDDYRDIVAMQNGFRDYDDMRKQGYCLGDAYDRKPNQPKHRKGR